jgi:uncharacterized membrane protein YcaP (DUF421 family)
MNSYSLAKAQERKELSEKIQAYLERGGEISVIPKGVSSIKEMHGHEYHKVRGIQDGSLLAYQKKRGNSEDNQ